MGENLYLICNMDLRRNLNNKQKNYNVMGKNYYLICNKDLRRNFNNK